MMQALSFLLLLTLPPSVTLYKIFQSKIPNGDAVQHPCHEGIWQGVGHFIDEGTGHRNPFGVDFENEGKIWTVNLCQKDSDGDGRTNGQELGDPNCVWSEGDIPDRTTDLTHPGICEPRNSTDCLSKNVTSPKYRTQGDWMNDMCKSKDFVCAGLNESDVRNVSLRVSSGSPVPAKETTYMCQIFDFETMTTPGDYHLIAVEPIQDNRYVIHHIGLFGCDDSEVPSESPFECGMLPSNKCMKILSIWTVGLPGDCFHPNTGIRIGANGYKRMALQLHWNNPEERGGLIDSSGLLLHFTPNIRQYEAAFLTTGLYKFIIPPAKEKFQLKSTCTSACTRTSFRGQAWVTSAWNHMHYAGKKMSIELIRNNKTLTFLTNDVAYSYDSPHISYYTDNPIQLLPGDELVTRCEYSTLNRTKSTKWGEATNDEMCFGFLTFYPKENISNLLCLSGGPDISLCDSTTYRGCKDLNKFKSPYYVNSTRLYRDLQQACHKFSPCLDECTRAILRHKSENPCLQDEIFTYIKSQMLTTHDLGKELLALMASCAVEVYQALSSPTTQELATS